MGIFSLPFLEEENKDDMPEMHAKEHLLYNGRQLHKRGWNGKEMNIERAVHLNAEVANTLP